MCIATENRAKLYRQGIDTSTDYGGWLARRVAATLKEMMVKFLITHDAQCSSANDDFLLSVLLTVLDRYIASAKRAKHAMQEKLTKKPKKKRKGSQEADLGDQI